MRCNIFIYLCGALLAQLGLVHGKQTPLLSHGSNRVNVSATLFAELEELARIVDIAYCVGLASTGISKPFRCLSRCHDFPSFELVTTWNTGPLLSDSCGYIALDHDRGRIIVAFRGTYSIANTIIDLSTIPQAYIPYPGTDHRNDQTSAQVPEGASKASDKHTGSGAVGEPRCTNCTVHMGFHASWLVTQRWISHDLEEQIFLHPRYELNLVGHSLGGAVAALAGLNFMARGWKPVVTTFGEPRIGNVGLVEYLDQRFDLRNDSVPRNDSLIKYRRVTHIDDPVPLLPLSEWGYAMHAGEIYISKPSLSPDVMDLRHCNGDNDPNCLAGQDSTATGLPSTDLITMRQRDLLTAVKEEIQDVIHEPWGIPSRYKLWQLFFAHRDYFWRLGLCVPGGDPMGGGEKFEHINLGL